MTIGFLGFLTLLLVAAKLFGFATFSWFVAFLPIILGLSVAAFVWIFVIVGAIIIAAKTGR